MLIAQSCPTLYDPKDCSPPGSSVHGASQARILEQVAISFSRGSSRPRKQTHLSCISCIAKWILHHWATWEPQQLLGRCLKDSWLLFLSPVSSSLVFPSRQTHSYTGGRSGSLPRWGAIRPRTVDHWEPVSWISDSYGATVHSRGSCPHHACPPWIWAGSVQAPSWNLLLRPELPWTESFDQPLTGEATAGTQFICTCLVPSSSHPWCTSFLRLRYQTGTSYHAGGQKSKTGQKGRCWQHLALSRGTRGKSVSRALSPQIFDAWSLSSSCKPSHVGPCFLFSQSLVLESGFLASYEDTSAYI